MKYLSNCCRTLAVKLVTFARSTALRLYDRFTLFPMVRMGRTYPAHHPACFIGQALSKKVPVVHSPNDDCFSHWRSRRVAVVPFCRGNHGRSATFNEWEAGAMAVRKNSRVDRGHQAFLFHLDGTLFPLDRGSIHGCHHCIRPLFHQ